MRNKRKVILIAVVSVVIISCVIATVYKNSKLYYKSREVGDTIKLGEYEIDNLAFNGDDKIEWLVLAKEDDKMLVITKECIELKVFNHNAFGSDGEFVNWGTSELREWLNNKFFNETFSDKEKKLILTSNVEATPNPDHNCFAGNDASDKIFLLSIDEANKYFDSDEARVASPTEYLVSTFSEINGESYLTDNNSIPWMLRTVGSTEYYVSIVNKDGSIDSDGYNPNSELATLRPAMWIDIS